jgi:anti-sigma-K factor RskA
VSEETRHDCGGDAAAFVLGALAPEEAEAFRRHLEACAVCRDEVAAFERVVDVLPAAVPQYRAPRGLRRRVLTAAREAAGPSPAPAPRRGAPGWLTVPRLAGAGLGALAAAAVVVAIVLSTGGTGTRLITAAVAGQGKAQVRLRGGQAELVLRGFPAPPPGEVYQVWLQRGSARPLPTRTLFSVTTQGAADVGVAGRLGGVSRLMVTAEPAGGSRAPTHPAVLVAQLHA